MRLLISSPILASGLDFGWQKSTGVGIGICIVLGVLSILSWAVMAMKLSLLRKSRIANAEFLAVFRSSPHPLALFQTGERFDFAPFYHIYHGAARELAFHLLGVDQPDRTFATRLQGAGRITPSQMGSVQLAMERASAEAALKFEQKMSVVAIALSGAPFIGLLGTVWGVMDSFAALANTQQGAATIQAMAPGVCAALLTTVVGLLVAIPSMFGYNLLVNKIRTSIVRLDNFCSELCTTFDRHYVDHQAKTELPSIGSMSTANVVPFAAGARTMPPPSTQVANA
jgi:biopolymer transport protein TolQ